MIRLTPDQLGTQIPSPCVNLCKINRDTDLCEGCWRTLDEIISWGTANDAVKTDIWQKITQRKSKQR